MKVHYPKLYNMAHLSLNVFTASKGSSNYILFYGLVLPSIMMGSYTHNVLSKNTSAGKNVHFSCWKCSFLIQQKKY